LLLQVLLDLVTYAFIHPVDGFRARQAVRRLRGPVRVSLGSGPTLDEGWIGLDLVGASSVFRADLRRRLPFPTQSVDVILAEHVFEHLYLDDLPALMRECHRVLRPGGVLRVVCPDGQLVATLITDNGDARAQAHLKFEQSLHRFKPDALLALRAVNRLVFQWGDHLSLLTGSGVALLLEKAGFCDIAILAADESRYFEEIPGTHLRLHPQSVHEAFAVECVSTQTGTLG
jgi:predicted SAM-dependent methyltransferase